MRHSNSHYVSFIYIYIYSFLLVWCNKIVSYSDFIKLELFNKQIKMIEYYFTRESNCSIFEAKLQTYYFFKKYKKYLWIPKISLNISVYIYLDFYYFFLLLCLNNKLKFEENQSSSQILFYELLFWICFYSTLK